MRLKTWSCHRASGVPPSDLLWRKITRMSVNHLAGKRGGRVPWAAAKALPDRWDWNESLAIEEEWELDIRRLEGVSPFRVTSRVHGYFYHLDGSVVCEGHFWQHLTIRGGMEWGKTPSDAAATMAANCSDACNVTLSEKIAFWDMHFSSCIDLHH